jgi:hypothetical protein
MAVGFRSRYRHAFRCLVRNPLPRDGFAPARLKDAEARLGVKLPKALWDYYALVGRHKINQVHNRLLPPDRLDVEKRHLVFMEENQGVVYWGLRRTDLGEKDPTVLQSLDPEEDPWYSERTRCSDFLIAMLCWQAVGGGLPYTGYSEGLGADAVGRIRRAWPFIAKMHGLAAYGSPGQAVCVLSAEESFVIHVGARTQRDFRDIEKRAGVPLDSI